MGPSHREIVNYQTLSNLLLGVIAYYFSIPSTPGHIIFVGTASWHFSTPRILFLVIRTDNVGSRITILLLQEHRPKTTVAILPYIQQKCQKKNREFLVDPKNTEAKRKKTLG